MRQTLDQGNSSDSIQEIPCSRSPRSSRGGYLAQPKTRQVVYENRSMDPDDHKDQALLEFHRMNAMMTSEAEVQTDEELLQPLLCTLRRRKFSNVSGSQPRAGDSDRMEVAETTRRKSSSGSASSINSRKSGEGSGSLFQRKSSASSNTPTLGDNGSGMFGKPGGHSRSSSQSNNNRFDPSCAVSRSERSPLLGSDRGFPGDESTSEETLSEGEHDPGEDLEELLIGAGEYHNSFSSLCSSSNLDSTPDTRQAADRRAGVSPRGALVAYSGAELPASFCTNLAPRTRVIGRTSHPVDKPKMKAVSSGRAEPVAILTEQDITSTYTIPTESARRSQRTRDVQSVSPSSGYNSSSTVCAADDLSHVPEIRVSKATPKCERYGDPADVGSSYYSRLSSHEPLDQNIPPGPTYTSYPVGSEGGSTSRSKNDRQRSYSHETGSEDGVSTGTGMHSSDSITLFQQYLRNRGLDLDLTSVQSSDV